MKKKIISLCMALMMVCGMIPVSASAANPVTISKYGMSITISDVVSYEDVTICHPRIFEALEDFDGTIDDCIEKIRIYHLPKDAAITLKNIGETGDDWHTDTMSAWLTNAYLNKNYQTESGAPLPYPCFNEWEAMWNAEDDDEFSEYIGSLKKGESSGKFFPKLPTELGKLSRIYLQIGEVPNDPFYGDVGGIHGELNIYCAYDNGEYSYTDNAIKKSAQPSSEYIYDTSDPGANTKLPVNALDRVTDSTSAANAVRQLTNSMTSEQKSSATGIDLATLFAETAAAKAASKTVNSNEILISAATVADMETSAAQAAKAVESALTNGGITTARYLANTVTLTTGETEKITIKIDPDILTTDVDKIRVETPSYALTLRVADLAEDLKESITIAAEDVGSGFAPGGANSKTTVKIDLPKAQMTNPVIVSLPRDSGDTTYQAVVKTDGTATASKYNPATITIDGRINASGTYTVKTNEKSFTDISNKSAEMQKAILYLTSKGIINGTSATTFSPDNSISRQQIAALLMRALGKVDNTATTTFKDVSKSSSLYHAIASSQKHGVINGYTDNTFRGTNVISRAQIVTVSGRVLTSEMNYKAPANMSAYLAKYSDTVPDYAQAMVALATREGLIVYRTDGTFSGGKNMTRGDAAIILYRLFQKIW